MFSRISIVASAVFIGGLLALATAPGCGPSATKRACMGGGNPQSPLVTDAVMVRLDVYGASAHCADGQLAAGAGAPLLSRTYVQGQAISLDVPPGPHALVLSTFADSDGTQLLGIGCTEADLSAGSQICFDLTIEPAPDGGDDLSGAVCSTSPDDCPSGQYCNGSACVPGCSSDGDCPKNDAGIGGCNTTTHLCAECAVDAHCGGAIGAKCCNARCVNTKSDAQNCNGCGLACTGANTSCCNAVCANPTNDANNCGGCGTACSTLNASAATCGGSTCAWTCNAGYAHCATGNTGCETNLASAGKKVCGAACVSAASCCSSADCMSPPAPAACRQTGVCSGVGGSCSYALKAGSVVCGATCCNAINGTCNGTCGLACNSGFGDCDGDPSNGCETNLAGAGKKLCGGACIPVATCCTSADCTTPQAPAACYATQGACPGAGGTCTYTENSGSQICGTTCCNADHGSCNAGTCTLNCASGYFDCNAAPTDGCETLCTPAHASGGCSGGACAIGTCTAGFFDCNATVSDGCECSTGTGCCAGGTCQIQHSNGLGQSFYDCTALNTFNVTEAMAACVAHTGDATQCAQFDCTPSSGKTSIDGVVCDNKGNGTTCNCWDYNEAGHTGTAPGSIDDTCLCPYTGETPMWH